MALTATDVNAITFPHIADKMVDNIFDKSPEFTRLWRKRKRWMGGLNARLPIEYATNTTGGAFTGTDARDLQNPTFITDARFELKEYYKGMQITDRQQELNKGRAAQISYVRSTVANGEKSLRKDLAEDYWDTSATEPGTQTIEGLKDILSTSSTYGGVAVADFADWIATIDSTSTTLGIAVLMNLYQDISDGEETPTACFTTKRLHAKLAVLLQAQQRFVKAGAADVMGESLAFLHVPVIASAYAIGTGGGTSDSYFVMVNENFFVLFVSSAYAARPGRWKDMKPQYPLIANSVELKCAFGVSKRKRQGACTTLDPDK
jgi:hypothetical protein